VGSLSFGLHPSYRVAVISLFIIGSGMATLQTANNAEKSESEWSLSRTRPRRMLLYEIKMCP